MSPGSARREVKSRDRRIFHRAAARLVSAGLTPNQVSVASGVFALIAAAGFFALERGGLILVLLGIQGRLICNLIDGLMAVEGGLKTPTGELYNEIPDRFSDTVIFLGAAYAAGGDTVPWGWAAALASMATAYVRVLGAAGGAGHFFSGPFAKQHRMFVMNAAAVAATAELWFSGTSRALSWALMLVTAGAAVTCVTRLRRIAGALNGRRPS